MHYPFWLIPETGNAIVIAAMAVFHVFIAHFAVGGGLFLVLTELKGRREKSPTVSQAILDYDRRHTRFFLLVTLVLGSLTGVGIWFVIAVISPAATLTLIRLFTFGWATEWVFFLAEITTLLVYYYTWKTMQPRTHLAVGWLYFIFGWLSLVMINGIIGFMLTPGDWPATGSFWDAFFNPSFLPGLVFRSMLAFMLAGLFGFVTSVRIPDPATRHTMVRFTAMFVAVPFVFLLASGAWYVFALPPEQQATVLRISTEIPQYMHTFLGVSVVVFLGGLAMAWLLPHTAKNPVVYLLLALGLVQIGSFEYVREAGRRPWVIHGQIYSNGLAAQDLAEANKKGILAHAAWAPDTEITEKNRLEAGKTVYSLECMACHSIGGPMLDILERTERFTAFGMASQLDGQGKLLEYMPPFAGTPKERDALAAYIVRGLHDKQPQERDFAPAQYDTPVPPFDPEADAYTLLAWCDRGMVLVGDTELWTLGKPGNNLRATLIQRGPTPTVVGEGVRLEYALQEGFDTPAGEMAYDKELMTWTADGVEVMPYPDAPLDTPFMPYPLFTVTATDAGSGEVLATTRAVAPVSTEMGCKNCHAGGWRVDDAAGVSTETAEAVLEVHDRASDTDLLERARNGQAVACRDCHPGPDGGGEGELLSLSASIHGWHANYLTERGDEACTACHPADPGGATASFRGWHSFMGHSCATCHGAMEDHALALLKHEQQAGKPGAARLMEHLTPRMADSTEAVNARAPWTMQPDCATCHDFEQKPSPMATAFNQWAGPGSLYRQRHEDMGSVMCQACHGATHAVYAAENVYGADRDNIPPLQYQGTAATVGGGGDNCGVCHQTMRQYPIHHPIPGW